MRGWITSVWQACGRGIYEWWSGNSDNDGMVKTIDVKLWGSNQAIPIGQVWGFHLPGCCRYWRSKNKNVTVRTERGRGHIDFRSVPEVVWCQPQHMGGISGWSAARLIYDEYFTFPVSSLQAQCILFAMTVMTRNFSKPRSILWIICIIFPTYRRRSYKLRLG
jgi:hypothetical protein